MTLSLTIPDELAQQARENLENLDELVADFLRDELARRGYEAWWKDRFTEEERAILDAAKRRADEMRQSGVSHEEAVREFIRLRDGILETNQ